MSFALSVSSPSPEPMRSCRNPHRQHPESKIDDGPTR